MTRPTRAQPDEIRRRLLALLDDFGGHLGRSDLRNQVVALIPAVREMRALGISLVPEPASSARQRILYYLQRYQGTIISGEELSVVSGISEYARRVRELRVEHGWPILSGTTAREAAEDLAGEGGLTASEVERMRPDDYVLMGEQDREAAHRWNTARDIRAMRGVGAKERILAYLRLNVGKPVTYEELRYVAREASEWGRRTRELRTQEGWPVMTRFSGRPDLPPSVYVLESDRQSPPHDRLIPDLVRVAVLERDAWRCRKCGWDPAHRRPGDPRALLELHHIAHHVSGGSNDAGNLVTLCNVDHDEVHRLDLQARDLAAWLDDTSSRHRT